MDTKTIDAAAPVTITLPLPKTLIAALAESARRDGRSQDDVIRTALEIYAERATTERKATVATGSRDAAEATLPSWTGMARSSDDESVPSDDARRFASLGVGESADDGYDATNHEEWLRKHWRPD